MYEAVRFFFDFNNRYPVIWRVTSAQVNRFCWFVTAGRRYQRAPAGKLNNLYRVKVFTG
jgi:hypothetical protein